MRVFGEFLGPNELLILKMIIAANGMSFHPWFPPRTPIPLADL